MNNQESMVERRLRQNVDTVEQQSARIAELEAQLAAERAKNEKLQAQVERLKVLKITRRSKAVASRDEQIAELQAEITRLRQIVYTWEYSRAREWGSDHEKANEHAKRIAGETK